MSTKSRHSASIAAALGIAVGACMAILSPSVLAGPAAIISADVATSVSQPGNSAQRGVVLLVHPQKSTAAFLSILHLRAPLSNNGRFAVLNLIGAENKDVRYALVYVPQDVEVKPHDVVELEPGVGDLMRQPGQAVVAMIVKNGSRLSVTVVANEVSKVVLVPTKNGKPELWIEDLHTGDVEIFAFGQGEVRVQ